MVKAYSVTALSVKLQILSDVFSRSDRGSNTWLVPVAEST
jgi:hypothetical protein